MVGDDFSAAHGDRFQRRRDILKASTNLLHEGEWAALTMREVAAHTGVSAGALYQWFEGRDEIFAELSTTRLTRGIAQFEAMPDDLPFDEVLASMLRWVRTTWTTSAAGNSTTRRSPVFGIQVRRVRR